jgi:hypothetical protein
MTDEQERKLTAEFLLERRELLPKLKAAERKVRDLGSSLRSAGNRIDGNPHILTPEDKKLLASGPEIVDFIRDYIEMRRRIQELDAVLVE